MTPLCRWAESCAGALIGVDFEVLTPSPPTNSNELAGIPPQASTPLQSFTRVPRRPTISQAGEPTKQIPARSFRGFSPLQRFPSRAEPLSSGGSQPTGYVASPGFLTLSTLCSPHDLPGLFHPGPAPGVHSSRPCSSRDAVRRLQRRAPPGVPSRLRRAGPPLQGFDTSREARPRDPGFSRTHASVPPRASSPPRFLASGDRRVGQPDISPHVLSRPVGLSR